MPELYLKENVLPQYVSKYGKYIALKRVVKIDGIYQVFDLPLLNENPKWYYSERSSFRYRWAENFEDDDITEKEALQILKDYGLDPNMLYEELTI